MTAATIVIARARVLRARARTGPRCWRRVIIGVASIEFSNALRTKGFRSATLLGLVASATLAARGEALRHRRVPDLLRAGRRRLDAVVLVGGHARAGRCSASPPPCSGSRTSAASAGSRACCSRRRDGVGLILGVAICTIAYDVFGFFVGSQFGRTPIAPKVSPNKSVQGTRRGHGRVARSSAGSSSATSRPWNRALRRLVLGLLVAGGAFLGDLCESMIKRDLGLKDFGTLLPGPRRGARPVRRAAVLPADRLLPRGRAQDRLRRTPAPSAAGAAAAHRPLTSRP